MAFGLFKKSETAETIYYNGNIYTQNPDLPEATAVACADGKIIAVGDFDAMGELVNDDTVTVDLEGKFMFPGFIDTHSISVLNAFQDKYFSIDPAWDVEELVENLREYASDNSDAEMIFGYGYDEEIFGEEEVDVEKIIALLDDACNDKPVLLLSQSNIHIWYNSPAENIIMSTAEEECVEIITVPYVLNLFVPFDFDEIEQSVKLEMSSNCDKGYTTIFNNDSPDYFDDIYVDSLISLMNEDSVPQRFYGSMFCAKPVNQETLVYKLMQKKTNCLEMGDIMKYNFLKLEVSDDNFSQNALTTIMLAVAERGFNVYIDAMDEAGLLMAYNSFDVVYSKGNKNFVALIASDYELEEAALNDFHHAGDVIETWLANTEDYVFEDNVDDVEEAIDELTVYAAEMLGEENRLGSIEVGKLADFTVFEKNPFDVGLKAFGQMHCLFTVIDGQIAYDAEEEAKDELYDLMSSQQF